MIKIAFITENYHKIEDEDISQVEPYIPQTISLNQNTLYFAIKRKFNKPNGKKYN